MSDDMAKDEYGVLWPSFMPAMKREIKAEMERKVGAVEKAKTNPAPRKPPGDECFYRPQRLKRNA